MIASLACFRKAAQQAGIQRKTGARRFAACLYSTACSRALAAVTLAAALAIFPLIAGADEVMSVTRDQIFIGKTDPSGKEDGNFLTTHPRNVHGTAPQGPAQPNYSMPEVQVHVPWHGSSRQPHPGQQPPARRGTR